MAFYRMSGGSKGELHGASILVTTEDESLTTVELYLGDTKVKGGIFKEGACLFTDILEIGEYKAKSGEYESDIVDITASDIINKVTKSVSISTTVTINLILEGAKEDTITITDKNGATVGVCIFPTGSTVGEIEVDIVDGQPYTFTSSIAKDTETGTSDYSKTVVLTDETPENPQDLILGRTYLMGGYRWTCAEAIDGGYCLQSQGVTADTWNNLFNSATTNQDGVDCHARNSVLNDLYSKIESTEKTTSYGSGLFLVSNSKCGTTASGTQGSGNYWKAHKIGATNYSQFSSSKDHSMLGTSHNVSGSYEWSVKSDGNVSDGGYYSITRSTVVVVAPAFNIDKTKITKDRISLAHEIKVMPEGALYWYGNECSDITGGWSGKGYNIGSSSWGTIEATKHTNYARIENKTGSYDWCVFGTTNEIKLVGHNAIYINISDPYFPSGRDNLGLAITSSTSKNPVVGNIATDLTYGHEGISKQNIPNTANMAYVLSFGSKEYGGTAHAIWLE